MASTTDLLSEYNASEVRFFRDEEVGLNGIIALHDTRLGPAGGGTRRYAYASEEDALEDVLRLAEAMTYKYALAGIDMGGAKGVIWVDNEKQRSEALYRSYARVVDSFDGRFITGSDVGTDKECLRWMSRETEYVTGLPEQFPRPTDDFFHAGGLGVINAMAGCCELVFGSDDLGDRHVAVQGVGEMGEHVVRYLSRRGAQVTVADINRERVDQLADELHVGTADPESIHAVDCDVFVPAALGGVLNAETIPQLECEIVCGPANNQFDSSQDAVRLADAGVLHAPDFLASSGTIIEHTDLLRQGGYSHQRVLEYLRRIKDQMREVGKRAERQERPPQHVATELARERIESIRSIRPSMRSAPSPEW
ncbi:leucine dehydrogenase [Haloferax sp. Atlit-12N]|uniref:Leu/Phe/Val dehydrogenase n=1 Tax=Haloferax sp. Atlit-12N TaxID=2077203 RepID=UPI000E24CC17|nr:Glu/Leu/Phe/Val dehydrogenase dimerization domain-containing protein [Haloferax sp. Atlit-12N]RDZ59736.1 leucine dehydrogenase [Haloferax sp. Atlit-12N]